MAIAISGVAVELREVDLKAKPERMLQLSPKGTVPVLALPDGCVLDESLDIMLWAFRPHDPLGMLDGFSEEPKALVRLNDSEFKQALDRYKYPERYPDFSALHYRTEGEIFLRDLNDRLAQNAYLFDGKPGIADLAVMPFVRQFAQVNRAWFDASSHAALRAWLEKWVASDTFVSVMQKPAGEPSDATDPARAIAPESAPA